MSSRADQLREALSRCQQRRHYCARVLQQFLDTADLNNVEQARSHRKLIADLHMSQNDCEILQRLLDEAHGDAGKGFARDAAE